MNQDALKQAVLGAQQIGTPTSPLGNFPELAKLYQSSFQLPQSQAAVKGEANNADVTIANQKAAAKAESDLQDSSKYQRLPKSDGGYSFVDPTGKEISAYDYARATGKSLDKTVENSQNPIDIGFAQDYKNLQNFINHVVNNDQEKIQATIKANPALNKFKDDLPGLINQFKQHYPTVFGGSGSGNQPVNSTYIPNAGAAANNAVYAPTGIGG